MAAGKYYDLNTIPKIWGREERQEWLIDHIIPKNGLTVLTGATGSGKSSLMLAAAHAVAQGKPFLDAATEKTKVVFIDRENPLYVYLERFERLGIKETPDMDFWGIWDTDLEPQGPDYIGIEKFVDEHHPLLVFDSLVAFHPESEQDASETRRYMHMFRRLTGRGCTVVVIHHTGKQAVGSNKFYRGSSDIPASADTAWLLTNRGKDKHLKDLLLEPYKSREGVLQDLYLGLNEHTFVLSEFIKDDDPDYSKLDAAIRNNPRVNQTRLIELLAPLKRHKILKMLNLGVGKTHRYMLVKSPLNNSSYYTLGADTTAQ